MHTKYFEGPAGPSHSPQGNQALILGIQFRRAVLTDLKYLQETFTALQDRAQAVRKHSPGTKHCVRVFARGSF